MKVLKPAEEYKSVVVYKPEAVEYKCRAGSLHKREPECFAQVYNIVQQIELMLYCSMTHIL